MHSFLDPFLILKAAQVLRPSLLPFTESDPPIFLSFRPLPEMACRCPLRHNYRQPLFSPPNKRIRSALPPFWAFDPSLVVSGSFTPCGRVEVFCNGVSRARFPKPFPFSGGFPLSFLGVCFVAPRGTNPLAYSFLPSGSTFFNFFSPGQPHNHNLLFCSFACILPMQFFPPLLSSFSLPFVLVQGPFCVYAMVPIVLSPVLCQ